MLKQIEKFPNIRVLDINGGEPFLSPDHLQFLKLFVKTGRAKDVILIYTTNGTILNSAFLEPLRAFKGVEVAVSSEGVGDTYRYSRGHDGAEEQIEKALEFFASVPATRLEINYTLSALNIFGVREFLKWFKAMENKFNLCLSLGVVVGPQALQLQNLPQWFRQMALDELAKSDSSHVESIRKIMAESLDSSVDDPKFKLGYFWKFVNELDKVQGTSLTKTLPVYKMLEFS
jgi:hypothetical protein